MMRRMAITALLMVVFFFDRRSSGKHESCECGAE